MFGGCATEKEEQYWEQILNPKQSNQTAPRNCLKISAVEDLQVTTEVRISSLWFQIFWLVIVTTDVVWGTVKEILLFSLLKNALEMLIFLAKCFSSEGGGKVWKAYRQQGRESFPFVSDGCMLFFFSSIWLSHVSTLFEVKFISAFFHIK